MENHLKCNFVAERYSVCQFELKVDKDIVHVFGIFLQGEPVQHELSQTSAQSSWLSLTGTISCIGFLQARAIWQDAVKVCSYL